MDKQFVRGQRVVLGGYQPAVITGVHKAGQPIIRSGESAEHGAREYYDETMYSVTWQDSIDVLVTMTYDARALIGNGNVPMVDRWHVNDDGIPVWAGSTLGVR